MSNICWTYEPSIGNDGLYFDNLEEIPKNMSKYKCSCTASKGVYDNYKKLVYHIERDCHKKYLNKLNESLQKEDSDNELCISSSNTEKDENLQEKLQENLQEEETIMPKTPNNSAESVSYEVPVYVPEPSAADIITVDTYSSSSSEGCPDVLDTETPLVREDIVFKLGSLTEDNHQLKKEVVLLKQHIKEIKKQQRITRIMLIAVTIFFTSIFRTRRVEIRG